MPKPKKPPEQLRRRNAPEQWVVLPPDGCHLPAPAWPLGDPTPAEGALWTRLWSLPVAAWWHEQRVDPFVVARYVSVGLARPEHAALGRLEAELALTPAAMARLRLVVEVPETKPTTTASRYRHVAVE